MSRPSHYSPCIDLHVVRALYHEARFRRQPMTRLVNELLASALHGTAGWQAAHDTHGTLDTVTLQEPPHPYTVHRSPPPPVPV